jgi:hypothetical protein
MKSGNIIVKKSDRSSMQKIILCCFMVLITGCKSIGPGRIHMDRGTYNNVVRDTDQEQLLMNIVRGRYLEVTQYIQVGSLTASYSLSQTLAASASVTAVSNSPTSWTPTLSPSVTYSDTPTISYIPLSNIEFAKSLMTPVSMTNFLLLAHAGGYDHMALFRLFFEQIGSVNSNLLNQSGMLRFTPQYQKFNVIIDLMSTLYLSGAFEAPRAAIYDGQISALLIFRKHRENTPQALQLKRLLGISLGSKSIVFMEHPLLEAMEKKDGVLITNDNKSKAKNVVYVRLRSTYAIIDLLGRGVQIPYQDIEAHTTRELYYPNGKRFDWRAIMKNILTIYASDTEPTNDFLVKTYMHHHWFYIKSSDPASKDTFDSILRILTLTSAVAMNNNSMPMLTIPVTSNN